MWLFVDCYDSFSHILLHYILQDHSDILLIKSDELSLAQVIALAPERIILSPGPGRPEDELLCLQLVAHFIDKVPILGICLGHQIVAISLGAKCIKAKAPMHGKPDIIGWLPAAKIFKQLPQSTVVMRYHSLVVSDYAECLVPFAYSETTGELMAFGHQHFPCVGIQFHPESILTKHGHELINAWCDHEFF